jgi:hypothetical protein
MLDGDHTAPIAGNLVLQSGIPSGRQPNNMTIFRKYYGKAVSSITMAF